ncbi:MAG: hypothetical protein JWN52_2476 [Actinomycetia bacterium]|nr:hypothetical protein [Actinomycetes bacterium]
MAMLEAILSPEWEDRVYSFDAHWGPGQQMASMRSGSGDEYSIVFSLAGAYIRGFDHKSPMSPYGLDPARPWPGVIDDDPPEFAAQVTEPAFAHSFPDGPVPALTACLWRRTTDDRWRTGTIDFPDGSVDADGAKWMFELLVEGTPEACCRHAGDYFEVPVAAELVQHVYPTDPRLSPR